LCPCAVTPRSSAKPIDIAIQLRTFGSSIGEIVSLVQSQQISGYRIGEKQSGTRRDFQPSTVAGTKEAAALRDFDPADVRFGSQADMTARQVQVRFASESGPQHLITACRMSMTAGLMGVAFETAR